MLAAVTTGLAIAAALVDFNVETGIGRLCFRFFFVFGFRFLAELKSRIALTNAIDTFTGTVIASDSLVCLRAFPARQSALGGWTNDLASAAVSGVYEVLNAAKFWHIIAARGAIATRTIAIFAKFIAIVLTAVATYFAVVGIVRIVEPFAQRLALALAVDALLATSAQVVAFTTVLFAGIEIVGTTVVSASSPSCVTLACMGAVF